MKKIIFAAAVAAAMAIMPSCDKISPDKLNVILLNPQSAVSLDTKAAISGTEFPSTRKIMLSAYHNALSEGESGVYFKDELCSYNNGQWSAARYWPSSGTLDFLAYSADDFGHVENVSWNLSSLLSSVTMNVKDNSVNQDDIMVGFSKGKLKVDVPLTFYHAQALLSFTASCSDMPYDAAANKGVTINSITVNNAKCSGTLTSKRDDTQDAQKIVFSWSNLGGEKNLNALSQTVNLSASSSSVGSQLLVPAQPQTTITINYTIHQGRDSESRAVDNVLSYTTTLEGVSTWDAGYRYNYAISIGLTGIKLTVSVVDWQLREINVKI